MSSQSIFISYARKDGAELAQRLVEDLKKQGLDPWLDTQRMRGGASWTREIETALDKSSVVLALLTQGSYLSEICRAEQLRSLRKGKTVIPLLVEKGSDIPLHLEPKNYLDFTGDGYPHQFEQLLEDIAKNKGIGLKEQYRQTYVTAPPLPVNFVERPVELQALRNALMGEGTGRHIAVTAFRGMGGIGKTVLAQALCHDEVVQQAFPDGVVWITIGKESIISLKDQMREVGRAFKDEDLAQVDNELAAINQYRNTIRNKAALVVLDDVWNATLINPFRAESARSRLLFTTRDAGIAADVGAQEHRADLLTEEQSCTMLARWSGKQEDELPAESELLIQECGRLPLAISMIGAMLRGKPASYWQRVLDLLRNADLEKIKTQFPDYPYTDLLRAIQVSVDALDKQMQQRYLSLAVLLDDMVVPTNLQQCLWGVSAPEAMDTAEQLIKLSLAQREGESSSYISLHDLHLDYVRAQYPDRDALDLIREAVRLSFHIIGRDPTQFASQLTGRLLPYLGLAEIHEFILKLQAGAARPWLCPLKSALHPPGTGLLQTLYGHDRWISDVALTADGRRAVSASYDFTLKVWDMESGRELRTIMGHSGVPLGVAVSEDGRQAVSSYTDGTLKVWDLETGRELWTLKGHSAEIKGIAISADGKRAISASGDKTLKVWDLETGLQLHVFVGHLAWVNAVAISSSSSRAISASADRSLKVWDLLNRRLLHTFEGHTDDVTAVAISRDGSRAVSASDDKSLKLWDVQNGRELRTLEGHHNEITDVAMNAVGRVAVSASNDTILTVWNLDNGQEVRTLDGHSERVTGVALSADGHLAISSSYDKTLKIWDVKSRRELRPIQGHTEGIIGVAVSSDRQRAVTASDDHTLKIWALEGGNELISLQGHTNAVMGVAWTEDGQQVISASSDKTLIVWHVESGRKLNELRGHSLGVTDVALSRDGRKAVSASYDNTLIVWDLDHGHVLYTLRGHSGAVTGIALSADGKWAVSSSYDRTLKFWDIESGCEIRTLRGHSAWIKGTKLSADGQRVASFDDNTVRIWDVKSNQELHIIEAPSFIGMAIDTNGRKIVSASNDSTLRIWDVESGMPITAFTCDAAAQCCAFINNNEVIAGDASGRVYFLRLEE